MLDLSLQWLHDEVRKPYQHGVIRWYRDGEPVELETAKYSSNVSKAPNKAKYKNKVPLSLKRHASAREQEMADEMGEQELVISHRSLNTDLTAVSSSLNNPYYNNPVLELQREMKAISTKLDSVVWCTCATSKRDRHSKTPRDADDESSSKKPSSRHHRHRRYKDKEEEDE